MAGGGHDAEEYSRSRRSTAPFVPFGAARRGSATIRRLYSVVNVRRFARPARGPSAAGVDAVGLVVVVVSSEPTSAVVVRTYFSCPCPSQVPLSLGVSHQSVG